MARQYGPLRLASWSDEGWYGTKRERRWRFFGGAVSLILKRRVFNVEVNYERRLP